jgi:hypothetical protein
MAQYEWFKSNEFQNAIYERLKRKFEDEKIDGLPFTFSEYLSQLAKENQPILEERLTRSLAAAKTRDDALESVDKIAIAAIKNARDSKRSLVGQDDLEAAIKKLTFCTFWPFCR